MFDALIAKGFQVEHHGNAWAILTSDFPDVIKELEAALLGARISVEEIIAGGGGQAKGTAVRIRNANCHRDLSAS